MRCPCTCIKEGVVGSSSRFRLGLRGARPLKNVPIVEAKSEHPVASAIVAAARDEGFRPTVSGHDPEQGFKKSSCKHDGGPFPFPILSSVVAEYEAHIAALECKVGQLLWSWTCPKWHRASRPPATAVGIPISFVAAYIWSKRGRSGDESGRLEIGVAPI